MILRVAMFFTLYAATKVKLNDDSGVPFLGHQLLECLLYIDIKLRVKVQCLREEKYGNKKQLII